jgi:hypothetical protein
MDSAAASPPTVALLEQPQRHRRKWKRFAKAERCVGSRKNLLGMAEQVVVVGPPCCTVADTDWVALGRIWNQSPCADQQNQKERWALVACRT